MAAGSDGHPPDSVIEAYGQGKLSPVEAARLETHFATCQRCGERLGGVAADTFSDLLRDNTPTAEAIPAVREATPASPKATHRGPNRRMLLLGVGVGACLSFALAAGWLAWGRKDTSPVDDSGLRGTASRRSVLFLLPSRGLWYEDYQPARAALDRAGVRVVVATPNGQSSVLHPKSLRGQPGRPDSVPADLDLRAALAAPAFDALVCVGYEYEELTRPGTPTAAQVERLLRQADEKRSWLVGICAGQRVLGAFGLLRGRRVARQGENVGDLTALGATVQPDQRVVVDGRLITASGPEDAAEAATELLRRLGSAKGTPD